MRNPEHSCAAEIQDEVLLMTPLFGVEVDDDFSLLSTSCDTGCSKRGWHNPPSPRHPMQQQLFIVYCQIFNCVSTCYISTTSLTSSAIFRVKGSCLGNN